MARAILSLVAFPWNLHGHPMGFHMFPSKDLNLEFSYIDANFTNTTGGAQDAMVAQTSWSTHSVARSHRLPKQLGPPIHIVPPSPRVTIPQSRILKMFSVPQHSPESSTAVNQLYLCELLSIPNSSHFVGCSPTQFWGCDSWYAGIGSHHLTLLSLVLGC